MVGARFGVSLAKKMSSELHSLIFNGMSVILIPTHFMIQRWKEKNTQLALQIQRETGHGEPETDSGEPVGGNKPVSILDSRIILHGFYGIFTGILSAIMGVGGLPLTMSYLTVATDLPHHFVQGTALASTLPSIFTSATSYMMNGHTPLGLAAAVACGSMTGSALGAQLALSMTESQLRQLYMASLVIFGGRSFLSAVGNATRLLAKKSK